MVEAQFGLIDCLEVLIFGEGASNGKVAHVLLDIAADAYIDSYYDRRGIVLIDFEELGRVEVSEYEGGGALGLRRGSYTKLV